MQALSAPLALLVDAASYLISALSLALIRAHEPVPGVASNTDDADNASFWRQIGDGLRPALLVAVAGMLTGATLARALAALDALYAA